MLSQEAMKPLSRKTAAAIGKEEMDERGFCEGESMGLLLTCLPFIPFLV